MQGPWYEFKCSASGLLGSMVLICGGGGGCWKKWLCGGCGGGG
jgi:hypothetical protein